MVFKWDLVVSAFGVVILVVTALVIVANCYILLTIRKTLQFSTSIKFHLGLIAICDIIAAILLYLKYLMDIEDKSEQVRCRVIIGLVLVPCMASLLTNVSMCLECLTLLSKDLKRFGCFRYQSRTLTSRGCVILATCTIVTLIPPSGVVFPSPAASGGDEELQCVVVYPEVYHPFVLKLWAVLALLFCVLNILLMALVVHRLSKFFKKSNAIHTVVPMSAIKSGASTNAVTVCDNVSSSEQADVQTATTAADANSDISDCKSTHDTHSDTHGDTQRSVTVQLASSGTCVTQCADIRRPLRLQITPDTTSLPRQKSPVSSTQRRLLVLMMTATMFFTICYLPYAGAVFLYTFCPKHCTITPDHINFAATSLVFHGLFNIIVYTVKNKDFRQNLPIRRCSSRR